jgi:hypothetical protein
MKIRIMGLPAEVAETVRVLSETRALDVIQISNSYPNRGIGSQVRVYVEAQLSGSKNRPSDHGQES